MKVYVVFVVDAAQFLHLVDNASSGHDSSRKDIRALLEHLAVEEVEGQLRALEGKQVAALGALMAQKALVQQMGELKTELGAQTVALSDGVEREHDRAQQMGRLSEAEAKLRSRLNVIEAEKTRAVATIGKVWC